MRILPLGLLAVAAPGFAAPVPQAGATIPAKFHGEWARTPADCSAQGGENTIGFKVSARTITYYEETEEVQKVRLTDPNSLSYTAKMVWADGEEPSDGTLRLSGDGKRLLGKTRADDLVRCAK